MNDREYNPLSDEYNRYTPVPAEEDKEKRFLLFRAAAVLTVFLVLSLVLNPAGIKTDDTGIDIVVPTETLPIDTVPVTEEAYDLVGTWTNGEDWYRFFEDRTGYYYNGEYFFLLTWTPSGIDYRLSGAGITECSSEIVTYVSLDLVTAFSDGVLYIPDGVSGEFRYKRSEISPDDEKVIPLIGTEPEDRIQNTFWELYDYTGLDGEIYPSYIWLENGRFVTDVGNEELVQWEHFEGSYTMTDRATAELRGDFKYEYTIGNSSFSYSSDRFYVYYVIDSKGEHVIASCFSPAKFHLFRDDSVHL